MTHLACCTFLLYGSVSAMRPTNHTHMCFEGEVYCPSSSSKYYAYEVRRIGLYARTSSPHAGVFVAESSSTRLCRDLCCESMRERYTNLTPDPLQKRSAGDSRSSGSAGDLGPSVSMTSSSHLSALLILSWFGWYFFRFVPAHIRTSWFANMRRDSTAVSRAVTLSSK